MGYSSDVKKAAIHVYHWLQRNEVYAKNNRRLNSYGFVEEMFGIPSHGATLKQWVGKEEDDEAGPSSSARGGRRAAHLKIDDELGEQILEKFRSGTHINP